MKNSWWRWVALGAGLGCVVFGASRLPYLGNDDLVQQAARFTPPRRPAPKPVFIPDPPPAEPSSETPTLGEASQAKIEVRVKALAREMADMWTRNPEELVVVIDDAQRSVPSAPSVTLLLAIAHAETNGKILDVSEAGAVGLAQATPVAYRQEHLGGKLFVTKDYLVGSRAYIMKKPLGDADTIASMVVDSDTSATRKKAKRLLRAAKELRSFRNDVRKEYRSLKETQVVTWARYQKELIAKRDRMLEKHFGMPHARVKKELAYEASEYLGEHLDDRFSAKSMARFLVRHLDRKTAEARVLASKEEDVEEMTAALYNGGSHNVKRMLAGLIRTLPETEKYMRKVPATRRRLDSVIAGTGLGDSQVRTIR